MDVAVIAYHSGDDYQNTTSIARLNYYSGQIPGLPTVLFDGGLAVVGGGTNMYPAYLAKYNNRIAVPSSFTIEAEGTSSGMMDYEINITIEKVATAIDNPKLHVALTEKHIPDYWGGLSEVNYAMRLMAPNASGTQLDFSSGNLEEKAISFIVNQEWANENCELVIFLQNPSTKEILQGVKYDISEFGTTNTNDASLLEVYIPETVCNESFAPKVKIANFGLDNLTSLEINYHINEEPVVTYNWTGNLAFMESELVELPELSFTILSTNNFEAEVDNPNGQTDQYPGNNSMSLVMDEAPNVPGPVTLIMLLDDSPEELTWELLNSQGTVLQQGGPYTTPPTTIAEPLDISEPDCYSFIIYDSGGNGFATSGIYKLADGNSNIFFQNNNFGMEDHVQFSIVQTGIDKLNTMEEISIYPNPVVNSATVSFDMAEPGYVGLKIYNSIGSIVFENEKQLYSAGKQNIPIVTEELSRGIYYIYLEIGEQVLTKKIIVTK